MASYNPKKDSHLLFEGQRSGPLLQSDWDKFKRLTNLDKIQPDSARKKIEDGFLQMAQTPAGRQKIHETVATNKHMPISIDARYNETHHAGNYSDNSGVFVSEKHLNDSAGDVGNSLLHELTHSQQKKGSNLINDAETQAISMQMAVEAGDKSSIYYDPVYAKKHKNNLEKWNKIANGDPKEPLPKWAKPFEYKPAPGEDLESTESKERQAHAKKMYAKENASLETQAQYIQEYYVSRETQNKNLGKKDASWQVAAKTEAYKSADRTDVKKDNLPAERNDQRTIRDMKTRNPAIDEDALERERQKLCSERSGANLPDDYNQLMSEAIWDLGEQQQKDGGKSREGRAMFRDFANKANKKAAEINAKNQRNNEKGGQETDSDRSKTTSKEQKGNPKTVASNNTNNPDSSLRSTLRNAQEYQSDLENENTAIAAQKNAKGAEIA